MSNDSEDVVDTASLLAKGGGQGPAAGVRFEVQVATFLAMLAIGNTPLADFGFDGARVRRVRAQTNAPVDDVLVETDAGGYLSIQVKTTVNAGTGPDSVLHSVADQFVRHWICACAGTGEAGWNRPLDPATDRLILLVGPRTSGSVRTTLKDALDLHRLSDFPDTQSKATQEVFEKFRAALERAWTHHKGASPEPDDLRRLLRVCAVVELSLDGVHRRVAEHALRDRLDDPDDASLAFSRLADGMGKVIEQRAGADVDGMIQMLTRGNGTHDKRISLRPIRARHDEGAGFLAAVRSLYTYPVRLYRSCEWVDSITKITDLTRRPSETVNPMWALFLLSVVGVLSQYAMSCVLAVDTLNPRWVLGAYAGTTKVLAVFTYQITHMLRRAARFELTEEALILSAAVLTTMVVAIVTTVVGAARTKVNSRFDKRREFAAFLTLSVVARYVAVCLLLTVGLFVASLQLPSRWIFEHDAGLMVTSSLAGFVLTAIWVFVGRWRARRAGVVPTGSDFHNPLSYSIYAVLGLTMGASVWTTHFSQALMPSIGISFTDACYHQSDACSVRLLPNHLPSPVYLDKVNFNLSVQLVNPDNSFDPKPYGTRASFNIEKSRFDSSPLLVEEGRVNDGILTARRFVCPPEWKNGQHAIFVGQQPGFALVTLSEAPSPNYTATIPIEPVDNVGLVFREVGDGCTFWPASIAQH